MSDDNEPITGEWLLSMGMGEINPISLELSEPYQSPICVYFADDGKSQVVTYLMYEMTKKMAFVFTKFEDRFSNAIPIAHIATRGEIRYLFEALKPFSVMDENKTKLMNDGWFYPYESRIQKRAETCLPS
jgi:hypothetical protein